MTDAARTLKVLVIEDRADDAEMVVFTLEDAGYRVEWARVDTEATFGAALDSSVDVVLADYAVPSFDIMGALAQTRAAGHLVPFIVVSGTISEEVAVDCVKGGVADWVLKDRMARLPRAVAQAMEQSKLRQENKDALADVARSQEQLAQAQRVAHLGSWAWDVVGGVVTWSDELYRIYGLAPNEFRASFAGFLELVHPDDRATMEAAATASYRTGEPFGLDHRVVRPDGTVRVMHARGEAICDATGAVVAMLGTGQDVTEARAREAQLADTQNRLAEAQRLARLGSWQFDLASATMEWSDELYRIYGLDPAGPVPSLEERIAVIHPDDRAMVHAAVQGALDARTAFAIEHRIVRPDGTTRVVFMQGKRVGGAGDTPNWVVGTVQDVTERVEAAAALAASEAQFRSLAASAPEGVFQTDASGRCTYTNERWHVMTGLDSEASLGVEWDSVIHPDDRKGAFARWQEAALSGEEWTERFRIRTPGAALRWIRARTAALRDGSGRVTGFVGTLADVTDVVDAETIVSTARDQAIEATRAKSQFLANMSHEIRTPMNGVLGMADVLLGTDLDVTQRRCLNALHDSGQHLLVIIDDILDFSKIEAARLELEDVDFDLRGAVDEVARLLGPLAEDKGLSFTVNFGAGVPLWARGDPVRLGQVLTNLVANAVKFTESGSVNLAVGRGEGDGVRFAVTDTGIGIDPNQQQAILEPFTQADATTTRRFGGTGLGLTICRELVGLMGGAITLTSVVGAGTTVSFEVSLPEKTGPIAQANQETSLGAPSDDVVRPRGGRALVVDDVEVNQMVARYMLERLGYRVDVAGTGADAVEILCGAVRYDVVLMDALMPNMDGFQATAAIRRLEGPGRATPIIAVTASAMVGDREKCLAAGMNDYVSKPINSVALAAAVARCHPEGERPATRTCPPESADQARDLLRSEIAAGIDRLVADIGPDGAAAICTRFLDDLPGRLDSIQASVADVDRDQVRVAAHNLAGIAGTIGAQRLGDTAREVVQRCLAPAVPIADVLHDLLRQARQVGAVLTEQMSSHCAHA